MKRLFFLLTLFATINCFAQQQWNSENDINNYYINKRNDIIQKISEQQQKRDYWERLPEYIEDGRINKERRDMLIETGVRIAVLKAELNRLEEEKINQLGLFRQKKAAEEEMRKKQEEEKRKKQVEEQKRQQQIAAQRKQIEAQKEQEAARIKKQQMEERQRQEAIARKKAEAERERQRERIRQIKQQQYNEGYNKSLTSSAKSYENKQQTLSRMDENMEELKNTPGYEIDGIPRQSGYNPSIGSSSTTYKRSKEGILKNVKRGENDAEKRARLLKEIEESERNNKLLQEEIQKLLQ